MPGINSTAGLTFQELIHRRKHWWYSRQEDTAHSVTECKQQLSEKASPEWRCCEYWQRSLSNKLNARAFAEEVGVPVATRLWSGRNVREIPFQELPGQFVVRPSIGSQGKNVYLFDNGFDLFRQTAMDTADLVDRLEQAVESDDRIHILFEEFVRDEAGQYAIPVEHQFYMFGRHLALICLIHRRSPNSLTQDRFYTPEFQPTDDLIRSAYPDKADPVEPPVCFDEMKEQARALGKAFDGFVRVDLFATDKGSVFCEFAALPNMGGGYTDYANRWLADLWREHLGDKI